MGGGLMQLVAYGAQDIYLTGNPQITFFKVVYRRHTNFAVESIEQTFNGSADFGKKFSCTISRNGDLLHRVYLECVLADASDNTDDGQGNNNNRAAIANFGFKMLDHVEVEIGGQCVDKHYGEWMQIWTHLTHDSDKLEMLGDMVDLPEDKTAGAVKNTLYVPLQFWFNRNPGLALPLIALQYHEVKLNVQFASSPAADADVKLDNCCVFCDYVFLDTDERRRFAQVSHEYLIEQVQFSNTLKMGGASSESNHELRFNHPVKELLWRTSNKEVLDSCLLQLNGHDRFRKRSGSYFTTVQRYQHHTGADGTAVGERVAGVHMYSFALKPEEHQPSGTCNFSRIDNAVLNVKETANAAGSLRVYAVNYNVLRIMSGMGGLAYSN
jgi:hypothetical protein